MFFFCLKPWSGTFYLVVLFVYFIIILIYIFLLLNKKSCLRPEKVG